MLEDESNLQVKLINHLVLKIETQRMPKSKQLLLNKVYPFHSTVTQPTLE